MKRVVPTMVRALFASASARCRLEFCPKTIWKTLIFVLASYTVWRWRRGLPNKTVVAQRLDACAMCQIYDRELRTCGTPNSVYDDGTGLKPYGCWCYMPLKARLNVNCWLSEVTDGADGWPSELNTDYARYKARAIVNPG